MIILALFWILECTKADDVSFLYNTKRSNETCGMFYRFDSHWAMIPPNKWRMIIDREWYEYLCYPEEPKENYYREDDNDRQDQVW